jgi:hypothetical protein
VGQMLNAHMICQSILMISLQKLKHDPVEILLVQTLHLIF